ncbi:hypothetical protein V8F20_005303 [Naviculisporaceae sp. PSN 640]
MENLRTPCSAWPNQMGNFGVVVGLAVNRGSGDSVVLVACADDSGAPSESRDAVVGSGSGRNEVTAELEVTRLEESGPCVVDAEVTDVVEKALDPEVESVVDTVPVLLDLGLKGSKWERDWDCEWSSGDKEPETYVGLTYDEPVRVIVVRWPDADVTRTSKEKLNRSADRQVSPFSWCKAFSSGVYIVGSPHLLPLELSRPWPKFELLMDVGASPGLTKTPAIVPQTIAVTTTTAASTNRTQYRRQQGTSS